MIRTDVYRLIDGERQYQDSLSAVRTEPMDEGEVHSVGEYATMMAHYQAELIRAWTLNPGNAQALEVIRKMAGIAVHCMEDHGAPKRGPVTKISDMPNGSVNQMLRRPTGEPEPGRFMPREAMSFPAGVALGPYVLGKGSLEHLEGVHPDLVWIVHYAIRITQQDFSVTDGVRSHMEQMRNVEAGVSQTMKSLHLIQPDGFGWAVDLVPWINGKARWELRACYKIMEAMRRASFARERLLRWGGAWTPLHDESPLVPPEGLVAAYVRRKKAKGKPAFIDGPHYEMVGLEG